MTGGFREDLWYRLNVFPILIPPLRARRDDILLLADHFIRKKSRELGLAVLPSLSPDAHHRLCGYHWPGNVRELENVIERALITQRGQPLTFRELEKSSKPAHAAPVEDFPEEIVSFEEVVYRHVVRALEVTNGRIEGEKGAAHLLRINPSTLRNKMRKLGIKATRARRSVPPGLPTETGSPPQ